MATIAVMIGTPTSTCLLAAATQRAEFALPARARPVPVRVRRAGDGVRRRLGRYRADLEDELAAVPPAREPATDFAEPQRRIREEMIR